MRFGELSKSKHTHTMFVGIHAFVRSLKLINRWHCPSEKQTEKTDTERHRLNNYRFVRCLCVCACMRISVVIRCSVSFVRCLRFCCGAVWALTHHVRLVVFAPIDILTELKYNPCVCTLLPCMEWTFAYENTIQIQFKFKPWTLLTNRHFNISTRRAFTHHVEIEKKKISRLGRTVLKTKER